MSYKEESILESPNIKYAVVDPYGKVMNNWFTDKEIKSLSSEVGIDISKIKVENITPILISRLENKGFVITSYKNVKINTRIPFESLYEDWEYIQKGY